MYNNIVRALTVLAVMLIAVTMSHAQGSETSLPIERLSSPNADKESVWTYAWGNPEPGNETTCQAVAFDPQNRALYVAGSSTGNTSNGVYLARCTTEGTPVWTRTWQSDEPGLSIESIAVDPDGGTYFCGAAPPGFHFKAGPEADQDTNGPSVADRPTAGLVKMTADGELIWASQWYAASGGSAQAAHVTVSGDGDVIVAGYYDGNGDYGRPGRLGSGEPLNAYVVAYSAEGERRWFNRVGGPGVQPPAGVCTDGSGNVYATWTWPRPVEFVSSTGNGLPPLTSDSNVFVFSMDKDGNPRWLKEVPISSTGNSLGIIFGAYDAEGNWVLPVPPDTSFSGVSLGIINKGDKIFVPMGCPGIATRFAVAAAILDADGNEVWCDYLLGAGGRFLPAGTHLDASGTLIVTGELESERASGEEEPSDVQHVWSLELSNDEASTTAGYLHLPRDAWVSLNSSALDPEGFLYFAGNSGNRGWLACMKYTQ